MSILYGAQQEAIKVQFVSHLTAMAIDNKLLIKSGDRVIMYAIATAIINNKDVCKKWLSSGF